MTDRGAGPHAYRSGVVGTSILARRTPERKEKQREFLAERDPSYFSLDGSQRVTR